MPPRRKQKPSEPAKDHVCPKCKATLHTTKNSLAIYYQRDCTGQVAPFQIPNNSIQETHHYEEFHTQGTRGDAGISSLAEVEPGSIVASQLNHH